MNTSNETTDESIGIILFLIWIKHLWELQPSPQDKVSAVNVSANPRLIHGCHQGMLQRTPGNISRCFCGVKSLCFRELEKRAKEHVEQHYVEIVILCDLAPPTVYECNTTEVT